MNSRELSILDVGHGNSAILQTDSGDVVIDCGRNETLHDHLNAYGVTIIDHIFISHADQDHVGGLNNILLDPDIDVGTLYVNTSTGKSNDTEFFQDVQVAVRKALDSNTLNALCTSVSSGQTENVEVSGAELTILGPPSYLTLPSEGGQNVDGSTITPNELSVVIRLDDDQHPVALFPGDIGRKGVQRIVEDGYDLTADILVFPHHGGVPENGEASSFAKDLIEEVEPKIVIFSISSNRSTPRQKILRGVAESDLTPHILCTQLSTHCIADRSEDPGALSPPEISKSYHDDNYCGGTVIIGLDGENTDYSHVIGRHSSFLDVYISKAACREHCNHLSPTSPNGQTPRHIPTGDALPERGNSGCEKDS